MRLVADCVLPIVLVAGGAGKKNFNVPCVGVSLGIERLFAIIEEKQREEGNVQRQNETQVRC